MKVESIRLNQLAQKFGLDLIILFGSHARGQTHRESDVDVAVHTISKDHDWQWEINLIREMVFALDCDNLDVTLTNDVSPLLMYEIARDGIPLYEANEGRFEDFQIYAAKRHADSYKIYRIQQLYLEDRLDEILS
jgi:predicted nucleotidyltransferase